MRAAESAMRAGVFAFDPPDRPGPDREKPRRRQGGSSSSKNFPRCQRRGARTPRKPVHARSGLGARQNANRPLGDALRPAEGTRRPLQPPRLLAILADRLLGLRARMQNQPIPKTVYAT